MKRTSIFIFLLAMVQVQTVFAANNKSNNEPDSVYLFSYATVKNNNHNGLHFAWSRDREHWFSIGNEFSFLRSDYGRWGSEKRMITPFLFLGPGGTWQCVWSLNERERLFAHAASKDLVDWGRQSYPEMNAGSNILRPVVQYDQQSGIYQITYTDAAGKYFRVITKDFKSYSPATEVSQAQYKNPSQTITLPEGSATGQMYRVPWSTVDQLINNYERKQYKNSLYNEFAKDDAQRFAGLKPVNAAISVQGANAKPISDLLLGIFFEDINYAADGGLYAELVQNRDFEYALSDKEGRDQKWNSTYAWTLKGEQTAFTMDSAAPIHANNPHYAVLQTTTPGASLVNSGFDGIAVRKGEQYNFSLFVKQLEGKGGKLLVRLVAKNGEVLAQANVQASSGTWKTSRAVLVPNADATDATLELQPLAAGRLAVDVISLFPQNTFKGRINGMRADLAQVIADIHPRFVRFPGGCVAHGDGLHNIYQWKNTIGPLQARKPQRNLWGYHQTAGLGYFEYFQFCEDIGAQPLPVIAAGVPCQNSGNGPHGGGQQGGIPMDQMDEYIQDILDLVEWANGDATTKWGKLRAAAGHPKPFNLKYIGIGNEDLITDVFEERFTMIYHALKEKHPEITVIGTVGPFYEGTDYEEGWEIASKLKVPMVDEHYYVSPGWFINNQDFYDRYDRSKPKVYLGEYAAHVPGRANNLETALAEALYLTAIERNGDVVSMTSYAPLLAKEGHTQWNPDMIYFNNTEVKPTVGYEVQKLYGHNSGNEYLTASINVSNNTEVVKKRIAFSVVRDSKSKDVIVKMVNLLPVTVNASVVLKDITLANTKGVKTVLQGKPDDKNLKPVISDCTVSENFSSELPPYSFTIIRIQTK
ncbi:carbohydrate binding domain-containing protein [Chitinophagaceae bacterium LB-8]|uniref:non-reducing end alpha-L-arabinofuranosidase n=1 Tax=Paraflavisolibacter caeni TaxID=2982496 RepID=A0A9X2XVQ7_9BACT|nr:alpha-L-arabinofuranosidase C-terminal domain-containing protein [Paraflavisolibacter caeni]MCU7550076.1 carbohydrate binding domain-containing protein [Paraflavisolibacter caeni]